MSPICEVWGVGGKYMMMGLTRRVQDKVFEEKYSKAVGRWDRHQNASVWPDFSDPAEAPTPGHGGSRPACSELAWASHGTPLSHHVG